MNIDSTPSRSAKPASITVIGSYIEALVMETPRLPLKGETLMGRNFRRTWGGKGSNQAVQVARLGAHTRFVSMVGADSSGDQFLQLMDHEHIERGCVFRHPELPTASGFIICTPDGHNVITIDIAALGALGSVEINTALVGIKSGDVALLQLEIPLETALYACAIAKAQGATVILNPAPAANLQAFDLSAVDYLTPNETEARVCLGLEPDDARSESDIARQLLQTGCRNVVVTLGDKGSLLVNSEGVQSVAPFPINPVVDSTGAGDAFNGGFATAIAEGQSVLEAMRFGNAAGALACTRADTIPSFHERQAVEDFLRQHP